MSFFTFFVFSLLVALLILRNTLGPRFEAVSGSRSREFLDGFLAVAVVVMFGAVGLTGIAMGPPPIRFAFVLLLLGAMAWLWFREFRFLMGLRDDDFPGHHDKLIWAMLLIFMAPVGVPVFWSYRRVHWPEPKRSGVEAGDELI